jgi:hypothetical protein
MILKSQLEEIVAEVLSERGVYDSDLTDDIVDRISTITEVMDDGEEGEDEELPRVLELD